MQAMNLTAIDQLFEKNPEIKSNRARRNAIHNAAPWLTKDEAGQALALWLRYRG